MVTTGKHLWRKHPAVRTGGDLTPGERAADALRARFGSWGFLGLLNLIFCAEIGIHIATRGRFDPGLLYLNLFLSWLAAQQGGALQIASNRGDRISAEVALHTQANTDTLTQQSGEILTLQQQQMQMLTGIEHLGAELARLKAKLDSVTAGTAVARNAAEAAFAGDQALAAVATAKPEAAHAAPDAGTEDKPPARPRPAVKTPKDNM